MNVGIIGFGQQMRDEYFPALLRQGFIVEFICDNADLQSKLPTHYPLDIVFYKSVSVIPQNTKTDILLVTLPHNQYSEVLPIIVSKGYGTILMEKPAALTTMSFMRTKKSILSSNANVSVASKRRFFKSYIDLRECLASAKDIKYLKIKIHRSFALENFGWRSEHLTGGASALSDLGYHAIDIMIWLLGQQRISVTESEFTSETKLFSMEKVVTRLSSKHSGIIVDIDVDRIAPSPFEQVTVITSDLQYVTTPHNIWVMPSELSRDKKQQVGEYQKGNEVDRLLNDMKSKFPKVLASYEEHQCHMEIIDLIQSGFKEETQ